MENLKIDWITTAITENNNYSESISSELPVIKYSFNGELVSANQAGIELLCTIKGASFETTTEYMINNYPHLLKHHCSDDFVLAYKNSKYFFSAVAFDEAGYIGWYCYRIQELQSGFLESVA